MATQMGRRRPRRVTHHWIPKVQYYEQSRYFSPTMEQIFLMTGYGSLNATLSSRTRETPSPSCPTRGTADEDWKHVLAYCPTYADIGNTDDWHIAINKNCTLDVGRALLQRESYDALNEFAKAAFRRRKIIVDEAAASAAAGLQRQQ